MREYELDLEMAEVLPHREALGTPSISVTVAPTVTVVSGVAIATQVLNVESTNLAAVVQHVAG